MSKKQREETLQQASFKQKKRGAGKTKWRTKKIDTTISQKNARFLERVLKEEDGTRHAFV